MSLQLQVFARKRKKYIRRALLCVLVFFAAMAQHVPWIPGVFGVRPLPLLPLVVCVAVFDQEIPAIFFGAFAGILWDFNAPGVPWRALYLTFVAFACAMLMRYLLNRNRLTIGLLVFASSALYLLLSWLVVSGDPRVLLRFSLPTLAYIMLVAPVCYFLAYWIVKRTSRKQRQVIAVQTLPPRITLGEPS